MKQRIFVSRLVGSTGYDLNILSVHRIENQLITISNLHTRCMGGDAMCTLTDDVIVETGATEILPVVHYLIIPDKQTYGYAVKRESADKGSANTPFKLRPSAEGLDAITANGKMLYTKRKDDLKALRLHRFDAMRHTMRPSIRAEKKVFEPEKMQSIVNLFPVMEEGMLKLVIEIITAKNNNVHHHRWSDLLSHAVYELTGSFRDYLSVFFYEQSDDYLTFEASCNGKLTSYSTYSIELSLPRDIPERLIFLMKLFDEALRHSKESTSEWSQPYDITQVSQASVLSCFDNIYLSKMRGRNTYDEHCIIENPMRRTIEEFLNVSGTVHNPETVSTLLLEKIAALLDKSSYPKVRAMLNYLQQHNSYQAVLDAKKNFAAMLGIDADAIVGEGDIAPKLAQINALEKRLLNTNSVDSLNVFITAFADFTKHKLVEKSFKKPSFDGGKYDDRYTEIHLLKDADFCVRDDQRISIKLKNNTAYQTYYAPGCPNHAIMADECKFLAKTLGLEFASDTDFHQELIFTPESSLQLQAQGVTINPVNLALQQSKRQTIILFSALSPCSNSAEVHDSQLRMKPSH